MGKSPEEARESIKGAIELYIESFGLEDLQKLYGVIGDTINTYMETNHED